MTTTMKPIETIDEAMYKYERECSHHTWDKYSKDYVPNESLSFLNKHYDIATREPVSLTRVRLNSQGYDSGGTYWGVGEPLYYFEHADSYYNHVEGYVRASSREEAKKKIQAKFPHYQLKFKR